MKSEKSETVPAVGEVCLGDLRRATPISDRWGVDRGDPVDRVYVEEFLGKHAADIRGRVLEVKDPGYAGHFGGDRVAQVDVVDIDTSNKSATIYADLQSAPQIASDSYDCIIATQVLPVIFDVHSAISTMYRVLKPDGVLLLTVPGPFSPVFQGDKFETFFWAFYPLTIRLLLERWFAPSSITIEAKGNLTTCVAFVAGMSQQDLAADDFRQDVEAYPLLIAARATK